MAETIHTVLRLAKETYLPALWSYAPVESVQDWIRWAGRQDGVERIEHVPRDEVAFDGPSAAEVFDLVGSNWRLRVAVMER